MTPQKTKTSPDILLDADRDGFTLLFENHPIPMWIYDLETLAFMDVNDAAQKKYGYSREEFLTLTLKDIRPADDVPRLIKNIKQERSPLQNSGEWRHRLKNGQIIDVEITSHTIEYNGRECALVLAQDVTERKRATQALQESESRYRDLVENSDVLICTHDLDGKLLSVNDAAVKLTGYPRDTLIGLNLKKALVLEDPREFDAYLAKIRRHGQAHGEMSVKTASGEIRIWEFNNTLRTEGTEQPIVRGMARDITEQKQAKIALHSSEKRFRALIENGLDNISLLTVDGTLLWESPSAISTLGYEPDEYIGRNMFELMHPDDMEGNRELYRQVIEQPGNSQRSSFRLRNSKGEWRWMEAIATNMLNEADVEAIVVNYRDITERKQMEDSLHQSEELFRNAFEHSAIGMALVSLNGKWLRVNTRLCSIVGYSEEEMLTKRFQDLTHPDDLALDLSHVNQMLEGKIESYTMEKRYIRKSGEIVWVLLAVSLMKNSDGTPLYFISQIKDINERKLAEQALLESELFAHSTLDALSAHIAILDGTGEIVAVNSAWREFAEANPPVTVNVCEGANYLAVCDAADGTEFKEAVEMAAAIRAVMSGRKNEFSLEYPCHSPEEKRWFNVRITRFGKNGDRRVVVAHENITERKLAENELRKSEERYRNIAEDMPVMMCRFKPDGTLTFINSFYCDYFGLSHDELLGSNLFALVPGPEQDTVREKYLSLNREKPFIAYEYKTTKPNGEECWQRWTDRALFNEQGETIEYQSIGEDITERKQADDALRRTEAHLEEAQRIAHLGSWDWIAATDTPHWSKELCNILEVDPDKPVPAMAEQDKLYAPDSMVRMRTSVEKTLQTGKPYEIELERVREDGSRRWLLARGERWLDERGELIGLHGTAFDITERKQAEEEKNRLIHELGERVKEVSFLHGVARIFMDYSRPEDEVMRDVVTAMPPAWQYPEITAARIGFNGQQYATPNFKETDWMLNQFFDLPGGNLGMIQVSYLEEKPQADEGPFLKEERHLLESMAEKIRTYLKGISSDRAINRQLAELETLYESGLAISRLLTPREVAQEVIGVLDRRMKWHHIAVRQYDPERNSVELIGFHKSGMSAEDEDGFIVKMNRIISNPSQGLSGWATVNGKSVRVPNVKIDNRYTMVFPEIYSGIYVPLKVGGRVIGSISVESEMENAFTEHDERLLETLAGQAAVAIENARLFHELQAEVIERRLIEDQVRQLNTELEDRVQERTLQIETTKRRLELAAHAGQIGVWEYNPRENKVVWDERMHMLHHEQPGVFDGTTKGWAKYIHPDDLQKSQMNTELAVTKNLLLNNEHRIVWPDGTIRHIATSAVTVFAEDGTPDRVIGISMDITERKQIEEALKLANAEMETALRVKDEFLANMSHELRTPLNAILGISESLEEQVVGALNDKQLKYTRIIKESGRHLLDLINDILDISKIEAGRMELDFHPISVEKLCQSSLRMVKELAQKKSLQVSFKVNGNAHVILGDERRLKQSLVNLLGNAVKFTEDGRQIGLEVNGYPERNEISFTVWDQGIGISQENLQYLFKPFVQLDAGLEREFQGTGLGLALVAQMIRLHGGHVSVESELGAGSRFTITLPWHAEEQNAQAKATGQLPPPKPRSNGKRRGRILIVEDTDIIVNLMNEYLRYKGYQVFVARNGREGILMAKNEQPDLILMDVMMPIMDGIEATKEIRADKSLRNIPIIALTALAMPGDRDRCLAAGMTDYMSKPVKMEELSKLIEKHLTEERQANDAK
jgi:PAS domain S-box-containing protein